MRRIAALIILLAASVLAVPLIAQEDPEADKGFLLRFVEEQLSAPDRQIDISGINGVLSSDVSIPRITVSDSEGVWLTIENAQLNWDQGALLGGRLQINSLTADSIDYARAAVPHEGIDLPPPEAKPLEIPEFPIAIVVGELSVPSVTFGEDLFGLGSEIGLSGNLELIDGSLDTKLDVTRKDGPGGTLALALSYDRETENADIDLSLAEPPDGLIVNLLGMEGKPDVALSLKGSGPLSSLRADMQLDVGGSQALSGFAQLTRVDEGLSVAAELGGPIADLVPAAYKSFFGADTRLDTKLVVRDAGGITIDTLSIAGGQLSLTASGATADDGFLERLALDASVAGTQGETVRIPGGGETTGIEAARLTIDYGQSQNWTAQFAVSGLETADLSAKNVLLDLGGAAVNLSDPSARRITFNGDGTISGISSPDPNLVEALGTEMGLGLAGLWTPDTALRLAELRLRGKVFDMALTGTLDGGAFDGDISLSAPSIASFSSFAGQQLGGAVDLKASGSVDAFSGGFDLTLDGTAQDLALGIDPLDAALAGTTRLSGRLARDEAGFLADTFAIESAVTSIGANGRFASDAADFRFEFALSDLAKVTDNAAGALTATGTAKGTGGNIALSFAAKVPSGELVDRRLADASLSFGGQLNDGALNGTISGLAFLDGHRTDLAAGISNADGVTRLSDLQFRTQGTQIAGTITRTQNGLFDGRLTLDANDLTLAGALALTEAEGAATADIALSHNDTQQSAAVTASVRDLVIGGDTRIAAADIKARVDDLFGVPAAVGTVSASDIQAAGITVDTFNAEASQQGGNATGFSANAALDNGAKIATAGSFGPDGDGYRLRLEQLTLDRGALSARLIDGTTARVADGTVSLDSAVLQVGGGRITSSGTAGDTLNLTVELAGVPLSVANAVMPELGLSGTLDGRVRVTGEASKPVVDFTASGSGIDAADIAEFGVAPISFSARGSFASNTLRLDALNADGARGTNFKASGTMPLEGTGGRLSVTGNLPLGLANRMLASRGAQASGTIAINAQVNGSLAKPSFGGSISTSDAEIVDPQSNLRLQNITAEARLNGDTATIESFRGSLAAGGAISASGSVSLDADAGFPANLTIALESARYADGTLVVATASGQLTLEGPLTRAPLLAGDIRLEKAEIAIPDSFGGESALLNVKHEDPPPQVAETIEKIARNTAGSEQSGSSGGLRLNITLSAPNQVFVRGRGLDAELGGRVLLTGPVASVRPVGGFELIRGRLTILGQRVTFDSGTVTLTGTLDPYVNFRASSPGSDITVYVSVRGPVSNLNIEFSSTPELPQDEVLSQLIFKRTLGDLSPLQLARLAAAASELAGGGGDSLTESLRSAAGLADLDIVTDAEGNTAVRAGTYVQDNVYVSVEAGTEGKSKVSIDLDLTDTLKATGSTTTDGEGSVGLFYEQDF